MRRRKPLVIDEWRVKRVRPFGPFPLTLTGYDTGSAMSPITNLTSITCILIWKFSLPISGCPDQLEKQMNRSSNTVI